jgi:hypothetical protein
VRENRGKKAHGMGGMCRSPSGECEGCEVCGVANTGPSPTALIALVALLVVLVGVVCDAVRLAIGVAEMLEVVPRRVNAMCCDGSTV